MMRKAGLYGTHFYGNHPITDSKAAHAFLKKKFDEKVKDDPFNDWGEARM